MTGQPVIVQVQAMDSKSFQDHAKHITDAVSHALAGGRGGTHLAETLRSSM